MLVSLSNKRLSYQRSSRIMHYLARDTQPLGSALLSLKKLSEDYSGGRTVAESAWTELTELARTLRKPATRDKLISAADESVSSTQQRRNPIVADAWRGLVEGVQGVADLVEAGIELRTRSEGVGSEAFAQENARVTHMVSEIDDFQVASPGDAALLRLITWLREPESVRLSGETFETLLAGELRPLFEIPRSDVGLPLRPPTDEEISTLVVGRDPLTVVRGYLSMGNRREVDALLESGAVPRSDELDDELLRAGRRLAIKHREAVVAADRVVSRLRALNDDDQARALAMVIEEHRTPAPDRYDLSLQPLSEVQDEANRRLGEVRSALIRRVDTLDDREAADRVRALIEGDDEPLAIEYLTLAEAGEPLPVLEPPSGDDFAAFCPAVVDLAAAESSGRTAIDAIRRYRGASGQSTNRVLSQGLKAWQGLIEQRQGGRPEQFGERVASTLRMLGLVPKSEGWMRTVSRTRRAGFVTVEVSASPLDLSYVPSLGTQAFGRYDVTVVFDQASPQRLLQYIEEDRRSRANLILYLGTLTVRQRYDLRKLTARAGFEFSPLVVDHAVIGWLSTLEEPAWRRTQRVTLPFTTHNPYTPFAGGEVPDEVFVGRDSERRAISDPTGSMFVYGGRQLGKSALLRRVEREFMARREVARNDGFDDGRLAVYLDLKSASIGEAAPPSSLWPTLAQRLTRLGIIPQDGRRSWTADTLPPAIQEWLDADHSRQFLLLLDEADNFLTSDSRDVGSSGLGAFPTLQRLKGLMERSGRRFKPVFAGLHQVQRFHDLPNTPVAHGGQDILVGPLSPVDARQLVRDPMYALGYEFETPETMWRLLLLTNYQASLIQIICYQLLQHMRTIGLPEDGGRVVITNRHVDEVYAKPDVRDLIAARFRWTINLDPRYLVIALVTAWLSFDAEPGQTFAPTELQDECESFWPAGFARKLLSSSEFVRYLEEMKGLGVLHRHGDKFGLRSPSIRSLLGSRDFIEAELEEVAETLSVDLGYNPSLNRRILPSDSKSGPEQRSPLCDADLGQLLGRAHVVVGTPALGIDRVAHAIELVAHERGREFSLVAPADLAEVLRRRYSDVQVTSLLNVEPAGVGDRLEAAQRANVNMTLIAAADQATSLDLDDKRIILLRRWSLEALQSWQETPFPTPASRELLRRVTGGWPDLVEEAAHRVGRGEDPHTAITHIGTRLTDPDFARAFLSSTGISLELAARWVEWFGVDGPDGLKECLPATYEDLETAGLGDDVQALVNRLVLCDVVEETPQGWILDRAVAEAASHLRS